MRRTYKSKKETGGGLDHREMVYNMDEKSSAFDAFYIQNIKQTKREQSCMGSSNQPGVSRNRVRKRKYVKRIVKEVENTPRDSLCNSAFLTPDKSIRVNKAPDLFDQLLNSSPTWLKPCNAKTEDLFDHLKFERPKEAKTYRRKRSVKKKFDYSSESSESDKENTTKTNDSSVQNATDIIAHELLIEKEANPSPREDISINKIVNKLTLINNMNRKSSVGLIDKDFKTNNRLTLNQSTSLKTSPFSSTPFTEKQRSQSIYKFSPIPMRSLDESQNYVTIIEEDDANKTNKSIVFVPTNSSNALKRSRDEDQKSPTTNVCCEKERSPSLFSSNPISTDESKSLKQINNQEINTHTEHSLQISVMEPFPGFPVEAIDVDNSMENKDDSIILTSAKLSKSSQRSKDRTTNEEKVADKEHLTMHVDNIECNTSKTDFAAESLPSKPFLGFIPNENVEPELNNTVEQSIKSNNSKMENTNESCNDEISSNEHTISSSTESDQEINKSSSVNDSEDGMKTLYDTCSSEASNKVEMLKEPVVLLKRMDTSLFNKYYEENKTHHSEASQDVSDDYTSFITGNDSNESSDENANKEMPLEPLVRLKKMINKYSEENKTRHSEASQDVSDDYTSFTTEIDSNESSDENANEEMPTEPLVRLEKMNTSLFNRYYKENKNSEDVDVSFDDTVDYEYPSAESDSFTTEKVSNDSQDENKNAEKDVTSVEDMSFQDTDSLDNREGSILEKDTNDEERCISFVTTRRRCDFTNDSTILVLDDSNDESITSGECDKTVISNKVDLNRSKQFDTAGADNVTLVEINTNLDYLKPDLDENELVNADTRPSSGTIRKSRLPRESPSRSSEITNGIVLQPGKKWERSLSIYRRMTTINDHFDRSIIDEEDLQNKGRRYRQSVIETMEMQGSLHNESINSRRSTFVPKPSRSTIRIVKETNNSRISISDTTVFEDLKSFLEDCDDTVVEFSKLSIAEDPDRTVLDKFHETNRVTTAQDYVLRRCNQSETIPFDECYPDPLLKNCRKIGEGVYGEVYLWRAPDGRARVMKIVPIAGTTRVNGERQKDFHEIISEIVIAMELSALRAPIAAIERQFDEGKDVDALDLHSVENATDVFNEVLGVRCVYGPYPSRLLDLWELYDETRGSENDSPASLPPHQQYLVLELANAGEDLESYLFNSAEQAYGLFLQVAFALAVGEEAYQFEHRDLHWGNVLIAPTDQKYATFIIRGRLYRVLRRGVAATVIDYSLSRVSVPLATAPSPPTAALYNDLATDQDLFAATGDYQFQVYRLMRDKLGNDWENYEPYTNILWLHYIVDKMITALRYKRTNTKTHKQFIAKLRAIKERLLTYHSAAQFVLTDNETIN